MNIDIKKLWASAKSPLVKKNDAIIKPFHRYYNNRGLVFPEQYFGIGSRINFNEDDRILKIFPIFKCDFLAHVKIQEIFNLFSSETAWVGDLVEKYHEYLVAVQTLELNHDGTAKRDKSGSKIRRVYGDLKSGSIVFVGVDPNGLNEVLVGEGIETVLSVQNHFPAKLALSAVNTHGLKRFNIPENYPMFHFLQDNDDAGQLSCQNQIKLAEVYSRSIKVSSSCIENDFNDALLSGGKDAIQKSLETTISYSPRDASCDDQGDCDLKTMPPVDILPKCLSDLLVDCSEHYENPVFDKMAFSAILSAASFSVQHLFDVSCSAHSSGLNNFFVVVAGSGAGKTYISKIFYGPLNNDQEENINEVFNEKSKDALDKIQGLIKVENDCTVEALQNKLCSEGKTLVLMNDEAGVVTAGYSMRDAKVNSAAFFNRLWDGSSYNFSRVGRSGYIHSSNRVSMFLGIQPNIWRLFADDQTKGQGLFSRCLITYCPWFVSDKYCEKALVNAGLSSYDAYEKRVRYLSNLQRTKRSIGVSSSGIKIIKNWYEKTLAPKVKTPDSIWFSEKEFIFKCQSHAYRLAAVFEVFQNIDAVEVSEESVQIAIKCMEYFILERFQQDHLRESKGLRSLKSKLKHKGLKVFSRTWIDKASVKRQKESTASFLDSMGSAIEGIDLPFGFSEEIDLKGTKHYPAKGYMLKTSNHNHLNS